LDKEKKDEEAKTNQESLDEGKEKDPEAEQKTDE
jgi:hypothetical protein